MLVTHVKTYNLLCTHLSIHQVYCMFFPAQRKKNLSICSNAGLCWAQSHQGITKWKKLWVVKGSSWKGLGVPPSTELLNLSPTPHGVNRLTHTPFSSGSGRGLQPFTRRLLMRFQNSLSKVKGAWPTVKKRSRGEMAALLVKSLLTQNHRTMCSRKAPGIHWEKWC